MKQIYTAQISAEQAEDIRMLVEACNDYDSSSLTFPLEEGNQFFLLYDNHKLLSALSLFFPEKGVCECSAFTCPDCRQRGYFYVLLETALEVVEKQEDEGTEIDFFFVTDEKNEAALAVLKNLESELCYREYMMALSLPHTLNRITAVSKIKIKETCKSFSTKEPSPRSFTFLADGRQVGGCRILVSDKTACLFDFYIETPFRRKGYGEAALCSMITILEEAPVPSISLQVSGDNKPALSLYKKAGFYVTQSLGYYLY